MGSLRSTYPTGCQEVSPAEWRCSGRAIGRAVQFWLSEPKRKWAEQAATSASGPDRTLSCDRTMWEMQEHLDNSAWTTTLGQQDLEKICVQIVEREMIRDLAADRVKRDLFVRLAGHFNATRVTWITRSVNASSAHRVSCMRG